MTRRITALVLATLASTSAGAFAADPPIAVTTCGQVIAAKAGFLTGNLDCTGFGDDALVLIDGSLDLRGFTLTGGDLNGVRCESSCTISSTVAGGTITGAKYNGVNVGTYLVPNTSAVLSDIIVTANGSLPHYQIGAYGPDVGVSVWGKAELNNVVVSNVVGDGVVGNVMVLNNSRVIDNRGNGLAGGTVRAMGSTISGNGGSGISADSITLDGAIIENNGASYPYQNGSWGPDGLLVSGKLLMSNSTVRFNTNNGIALHHSKASITDSTVVDNGGGSGIYGDGAKLKISGSQLERNYYGISSDGGSKVIVRDTLIANNNTGIYAFARNKVAVSDSEVTSNTSYGVRTVDYVFGGVTTYATRFSAKTSHFSANGLFDIATVQPPKFTYESGINDCVQSRRDAPGTQPHWGICALDCTNGVLNPGEICDTSGESGSCDDDCTVPLCGDGNVNETVGEECDDAGNTPGDGCDAVCIKEFCGDSIAQPGIGENCDAGGVSTMSCDSDCTAVVCGDDFRNPKAGEQCDDGNMNNGDGCSSACQKE